MSLLRTVYLGAVICGWMAFCGWFMAEILRQGVVQPAAAAGAGDAADSAPRFLGSQSLGAALSSERNQTIAAFCLVGAAIGAGLGLAAGLSNWQLIPQVMRMLRGIVAGGLGGIAGGWLGAMIYQMFTPAGDGGRWWLRPVGWMVAGSLVGLADGLFTASRNRMRNGLIGGLAGGLIGGILFDPIKALVAHTAGAGDATLQFEITSRAAGFVAVGLCIGGAVGLTHLLLRHAWLTVLDGDRPGRQVILGGSGLTLGSDPSAGLPFLREADRTLLPAHLRIVCGRDGSFSLVPAAPNADADVAIVKNGVRETRSLKSQGAGGITLANDCVIMCGRNSIRFNERSHRGEATQSGAATAAPGHPAPPPPQVLPPLPKPAWQEPARQPAPPAVAPPPVPPPRSMPQPPPPPPPKAQPAAQPAAPRGAAAPASMPASQPQPAPRPVPQPAARPAPQPVPPPPPQPKPQPMPTAGGDNVCPNGHKVPAGQRYCILCDTYF